MKVEKYYCDFCGTELKSIALYEIPIVTDDTTVFSKIDDDGFPDRSEGILKAATETKHTCLHCLLDIKHFFKVTIKASIDNRRTILENKTLSDVYPTMKDGEVK